MASTESARTLGTWPGQATGTKHEFQHLLSGSSPFRFPPILVLVGDDDSFCPLHLFASSPEE